MFNRRQRNRRSRPRQHQHVTLATRAMPDPHRSGASVTPGVYSDGCSLNSYQQDRHIVQTFQCTVPASGNTREETQTVHVLAVADGHGLRNDGHVVSSFIMADLCRMLEQYGCLPPPAEEPQQTQPVPPQPLEATNVREERVSVVEIKDVGTDEKEGNTNNNDNGSSGNGNNGIERRDSGKKANDTDMDNSANQNMNKNNNNNNDNNNENIDKGNDNKDVDDDDNKNDDDDDDDDNNNNNNDDDHKADNENDNNKTESKAQCNLRDAILALDAASIRVCQRFHRSCHAGSTLALAIHNDSTNTIHIANVGDSHCFILSHSLHPHSSSSNIEYIRVRSIPHVATNPTERQRVENAGGVFDLAGRVLGSISMTRALGDDDLKGERNRTSFRVPGRPPYDSSLFIADPDVMLVNIEEGDFALLLVSDGVSDFVEESVFVKLVASEFAKGRSASVAAKMITDRVQRIGGRDNATAVVHWLRAGRSSGWGDESGRGNGGRGRKKESVQQQQQQDSYSSGFLSVKQGQQANAGRNSGQHSERVQAEQSVAGRETTVVAAGGTTDEKNQGQDQEQDEQNRVRSTRLQSEPGGQRQTSDSLAAGKTDGLFKWLSRR